MEKFEKMRRNATDSDFNRNKIDLGKFDPMHADKSFFYPTLEAKKPVYEVCYKHSNKTY